MPMFEPGECPANIPLGKNHYSKVPNECRMGTVDLQKGQSVAADSGF